VANCYVAKYYVASCVVASCYVANCMGIKMTVVSYKTKLTKILKLVFNVLDWPLTTVDVLSAVSILPCR
jgi:hypothetical protein